MAWTSLLRLDIRQLMIATAVLALMFSIFGVVGGVINTLLLVLLFAPNKIKNQTKRMEARVWSASLIPSLAIFSLGLTYLSVSYALGRPPKPTDFRVSYQTPLIYGAKMMTDILLFLVPVSFFLGSFLSLAAAKHRLWDNPQLRPVRNVLLSLPGPVVWLITAILLFSDPFDWRSQVTG